MAFERICLQHLPQIKLALGFSAVISSAHSWIYKSKEKGETGAQIDLLIDRNDQTINLCEMKYAGDAYVIDEEEDQRLRHRQATFVRESGTKKTVLTTMITTYGLSKGGYSDEIHSQVVMSDLFRNADFDD